MTYHDRFADDRVVDFSICYFTVFTLSDRTPKLLALLYLKFEQGQFTTYCYMFKNS